MKTSCWSRSAAFIRAVRRRPGYVAVVLSALAHVTVFGSVFFLLHQNTRHSSASLPILVVAFGESDRAGVAVAAVSPDSGTLRKGDSNTPGGDEAKKPLTVVPAVVPPVLPPPKPVDVPEPEKVISSKPPLSTPVPVSPHAPLPAPVPVPEPPPAPPPSSVAATDKPVDAPSDSVKNTSNPTVRDLPPTANASDSPGGSPLPGELGGAPISSGSPSAGGKSAGSRNGVRIADGAKPPPYPAEAREAGLEGAPVIWLHVSKDGEVLESRVLKSCGYKVLDAAALNWARAQKFVPASHDGQAVDAEVTKPVRFYLS